MNLALPLGIFLAMWRRVHGAGSTIPYPGSLVAYERSNTETPMGGNARFQIYASLQGSKTHAQAFNIGAPTSTFAEKWPRMAKVFGLVGVPPINEGGIDVSKWVIDHKDVWNQMEVEYGLKPGAIEKTGWAFLIILYIPFDRDYDISRSREIGFSEDMDIAEAYKESWEFMAQAKLLPPV